MGEVQFEPPIDVLRRTAASLRRTLGAPGEGLATTIAAVADGDLDADLALGRLVRVLTRAGEGAASLLIAIDADYELLRWLLSHEDGRVHGPVIAAAGHQGMTSWLARDADPAVRRCVAVHAPTNVRLLEHLCVDDAESVRIMVASRDGLPESVASVLAQDVSWQVRFALAGRPGLPGVVVRRLATDDDRRVRARIGSKPEPGIGTASPRTSAAITA